MLNEQNQPLVHAGFHGNDKGDLCPIISLAERPGIIRRRGAARKKVEIFPTPKSTRGTVRAANSTRFHATRQCERPSEISYSQLFSTRRPAPRRAAPRQCEWALICLAFRLLM